MQSLCSSKIHFLPNILTLKFLTGAVIKEGNSGHRNEYIIIMVLWIILGAIVTHEAAHVLVARHFGGKWRGVRIRWTRVAVVIDTAGLSPPRLRWIAAAGLIVDVSCWLGFLIAVVVSTPIVSSEIVALVWFSILLAVNATPWIPGTDGWRFWQTEQKAGQ